MPVIVPHIRCEFCGRDMYGARPYNLSSSGSQYMHDPDPEQNEQWYRYFKCPNRNKVFEYFDGKVVESTAVLMPSPS